MVGKTDEPQHQSAGRKGIQTFRDGEGGRPPGDREHAPMDGKSDDRVHHGAVGRIDRDMRREPAGDVPQRFGAVFRQENGFDRKAPLPRQHAQYDLTLDDEAVLAADEIAFADGAVGFDPGIVGIADRYRHGNLGTDGDAYDGGRA